MRQRIFWQKFNMVSQKAKFDADMESIEKRQYVQPKERYRPKLFHTVIKMKTPFLQLFQWIRYQLQFLLPGIIKVFPARESLVSDIPVGDRKIGNFFLE
jgi:hypothetical protein